MRIVIIGNGVAGMEAALTVRQREPEVELTVISEESEHFFSRTALMYVLVGQLSHEQTEPHERDLYARLGLRRIRARAVGVDAEPRQVRLAGGLEPVPFDRLLIACGSRPRRGPWEGSDLTGIGHFVTHQDLSWLEAELYGEQRMEPAPEPEAHLPFSTADSPYQPREAASRSRGQVARQPVVVGGGLIGIEVIETMVARGLSPRFLIREEWFWPMAINRPESEWIAERMSHHGVKVDLEHNVERFVGDEAGRVCEVRTDRGSHPCDVCVIAIGVEPNTGWLEGSPVELDERGGIVVDRGLQTSLEGVFAAGDCASVEWFNGARRPEQLWYTGRDQGRLAGRALLGDTVSYARGTLYNSAKLMDIEYTTAGLVDFGLSEEAWHWFWAEEGKVRSTVRLTVEGDGRVVGFNLLGRRWDHEILVRWIEERRPVGWVLPRLQQAGFDTEFVPPLRLPAELCRDPSKGRLSPAGQGAA